MLFEVAFIIKKINMSLFDELKHDNEEHAKKAIEVNKKLAGIVNEDNSERSAFIEKHRVFQSKEIHEVFAEVVNDLKNNSRILEPNEVVSEKLLPISGCHIEYKDSIFFVKIEANPTIEKVHLTITIDRKEIDNREYQIAEFTKKAMADDIIKIIKSYIP